MAHTGIYGVKKIQIDKRIGFLEEHTYQGNDLGITFQKDQTTFKCWSPEADAMEVKIYQSGEAGNADQIMTLPMTQADNCWSVTTNEDVEGLFYTYGITRGDETVESVDLYAKAVGVNGNRGAILDVSKIHPEGWQDTSYTVPAASTDAYIWELHVEDFSSDPDSGISSENRGKYLAFTEKHTHLVNDTQQPTGMAYLKELGINYVHLLPIFDYDNDETAETYNWGYDPKNYNVPEGKYASDPFDPAARIRECKQMIQALHQENIGVVMDVVFNHTAITEQSWFNLTVPDYYYRQNNAGDFADGSACGNETASERKMMRKFIHDSVLFWAKEYHIDGFRFDLMGLHDVDTMNQLRQRLDEEGFEHVILYGEPWDAGSNQIMAPNIPANKSNVWALDERIAVFSDDLRDSIKGDVFEETDGAFIQGMNGRPQAKETFYLHDLATAIQGSPRYDDHHADNRWAKSPQQVIAYASVHDNLTLWDKLVATMTPENKQRVYGKDDMLLARNKLAAALLFTSQGAVLTQAGEEFGRTKEGDENSFRSSLRINQLDWQRAKEFKELRAIYRGLWQIRQNYAPLRDQTTASAMRMTFLTTNAENVIAYEIPNDDSTHPWQSMIVAANSSEQAWQLNLPETNENDHWCLVADTTAAGPEARMAEETLLAPLHFMIWVKMRRK
ncbi:pullulanase, type I [Enterococcus sp. 8G7_MSG3316]|uniref:Pullulanase, type I n=1 Tax=Candidatus Enterococcus testudinis TaxID=1834191 RepID=A0A242A270_9ENTE|nr:type I pullulanase [Enterococcus sp. 8G7_MSG3316]OTN75042.1 pullulanase, type I [Enterococcus sp. 8G7_MSG3316]